MTQTFTDINYDWLSRGRMLEIIDPALKTVFRKYTDEDSQFFMIDGQRIHFKVEGEGESVLLIHGSFSSIHTFDAWAKYLKRYYKVIRLDLPGFGLSGPHPRNEYSMQQVIDFVKNFLHILHTDKCNVVGSSLGGWVAWELAVKYPKLVNKLCLIDAAGFLDSKSIPLPFKMARTPFLRSMTKYSMRRTVIEVFMRQVFNDSAKVDQELVDRYYELNSIPGNPEAFVRMVNTKFIDHTHLLKTIKHPTLIMWGKQDNWLPLQNAYKFNLEIPNAELILYDGVGHIPMEECPKITSKDFRDFLR